MSDIVSFLQFVMISLGVLGLSIGIFGGIWVNSISRNPEGSDKMFVPGLIVLSCIELSIISCLGLAFLGYFKGF